MKIFERVGRILRADVHGVMDQLEERSLLLKQHLREAELDVFQKRSALDAIDEERLRIRVEGETLEAAVEVLDVDVELALAGDDAELARFAIRRLLPKRESLRALFAHAAQLDESRLRLRERLEVQEAQLEELRPQVRAALAQPRCHESLAGFDPRDVGSAGDAVNTAIVTDEEVDLELLRRQDSIRKRSVDSDLVSPGAAPQ